MEHPRKFYLILILAVLALVIIFAKQIQKTIGISIKTEDAPLISSDIYNIPIESSEVPRGNPGAAITIVEFLDLNCTDCLKQYSAINKLVDENPTKLQLFIKPADASGFFSHDSKYAHRAAYCANQQKRYWPFMDALMNKENRWSEESLLSAAADAKLNLNSWNLCRESETTASATDVALQTAKGLGVNMSPTIFVNNKKIDPKAEIDLSEIIKKFIP